MNKKIYAYLFAILLVLFPLEIAGVPNLHSINSVFADQLNIGGDDDLEDEIDDLQDEIEELEEKINKLQREGRSLQNEIAYFDTQINLTELKIQSANAEIAKRTDLINKLTDDITDLEGRIDELIESIDYQQRLLNSRMRERYKSVPSSPILVIFGSESLTEMVRKTEYLKVMQKQDQQLVNDWEDTKFNYIQQKDLFEDKREETEELKASVEAEKANLVFYQQNLDNQKAAKQALLVQTQNDEAKYQDELKKAKAQLEAIQAIVASINFENGVKVEEGDVIAVMGNSGYPDCSTGAHLHYEIRKDGEIKNPEKYLEPKTVYVNDFDSGTKKIGSGDWEWPMKNPEVTQRYGETPWSWRYPSGRHDGIDMIANDTFIYAPEDGKMVKGSIGCYSSVINYVAIDHGDDVISYFLHVR